MIARKFREKLNAGLGNIRKKCKNADSTFLPALSNAAYAAKAIAEKLPMPEANTKNPSGYVPSSIRRVKRSAHHGKFRKVS